jgi:hypothetical protein
VTRSATLGRHVAHATGAALENLEAFAVGARRRGCGHRRSGGGARNREPRRARAVIRNGARIMSRRRARRAV